LPGDRALSELPSVGANRLQLRLRNVLNSAATMAHCHYKFNTKFWNPQGNT
jgi:hypothetical protein